MSNETNGGCNPKRWQRPSLRDDLDVPLNLFDTTQEKTDMQTKVMALSLEAGKTNLQPGDAAAIELAFNSMLHVLRAHGVLLHRAECDVRDELAALGISISETVRAGEA